MNSTTANTIVLKYGKAKVVIARNVIPHVSDILEVIQGINILLKDDGYGIIEFHNAKTILEELLEEVQLHKLIIQLVIRELIMVDLISMHLLVMRKQLKLVQV